MAVKLIGADDVTADSGNYTNYFILSQFTAVASGNMTEFRVKCQASGNLKVAIYADNSNQPGALITAMNTGQAVVSGWNTLSFTSTPIVSGTKYWLAFISDYNNSVGYKTSAGWLRKYTAATYSTFSFPDPAGSLTDASGYYEIEAGWETLPVGRSFGYVIG